MLFEFVMRLTAPSAEIWTASFQVLGLTLLQVPQNMPPIYRDLGHRRVQFHSLPPVLYSMITDNVELSNTTCYRSISFALSVLHHCTKSKLYTRQFQGRPESSSVSRPSNPPHGSKCGNALADWFPHPTNTWQRVVLHRSSLLNRPSSFSFHWTCLEPE
jgi:hypothetical protein